ncbi:F0F1 ATP synthase subunit B [Coxiella endosymbiont of Amblyomma sculptum]|uniref:F0F1 ATP synthase subunit B n=1 Tax=Coxiella endosymbiont of Amblyomma sculptum TaxID=2487929 RepID=UPI00132E96E0|nr:F0F1 ATP synthase subunit B [Coxiella endosymbiont of Amblyomma sculptum]QHG92212.1 F0F1 ATP synthase subunit B [Coxiella endosymbiont of Amblyomma sculptum]
MNINVSLVIQMLVFVVFIILTMKFVWPPITKILEERQKNIADGLAAAEKGHRELRLAEKKAKESLTKTRVQATKILEQATQHADRIIIVAKNKAREERERILQIAKNDIAQEYNAAKIKLLEQVSAIVIESTKKILQREINAEINNDLLNEMTREI